MTFAELAEQQYKRFVDYMCLLANHKPSEYSLFITPNSQAIMYRSGALERRVLHSIRLKTFVGTLSSINEILEMVIHDQ